jgi:hypothetical protein
MKFGASKCGPEYPGQRPLLSGKQGLRRVSRPMSPWRQAARQPGDGWRDRWATLFLVNEDGSALYCGRDEGRLPWRY